MEKTRDTAARPYLDFVSGEDRKALLSTSDLEDSLGENLQTKKPSQSSLLVGVLLLVIISLSAFLGARFGGSYFMNFDAVCSRHTSMDCKPCWIS